MTDLENIPSSQNWHGVTDDNTRLSIRLDCDPDVPCQNITVDEISLWTWDGDYVFWQCENAYGQGACLQSATATTNLPTYTTVVTVGSWYVRTVLVSFFDIYSVLCGVS